MLNGAFTNSGTNGQRPTTPAEDRSLLPDEYGLSINMSDPEVAALWYSARQPLSSLAKVGPSVGAALQSYAATLRKIGSDRAIPLSVVQGGQGAIQQASSEVMAQVQKEREAAQKQFNVRLSDFEADVVKQAKTLRAIIGNAMAGKEVDTATALLEETRQMRAWTRIRPLFVQALSGQSADSTAMIASADTNGSAANAAIRAAISNADALSLRALKAELPIFLQSAGLGQLTASLMASLAEAEVPGLPSAARAARQIEAVVNFGLPRLQDGLKFVRSAVGGYSQSGGDGLLPALICGFASDTYVTASGFEQRNISM